MKFRPKIWVWQLLWLVFAASCINGRLSWDGGSGSGGGGGEDSGFPSLV